MRQGLAYAIIGTRGGKHDVIRAWGKGSDKAKSVKEIIAAKSMIVALPKKKNRVLFTVSDRFDGLASGIDHLFAFIEEDFASICCICE